MAVCGRRRSVRPFIVSALRAWQPSNQRCLAELSIPRHCRKLLRPLWAAESIAGSEVIWTKMEEGIVDRQTVSPAADTSADLANAAALDSGA